MSNIQGHVEERRNNHAAEGAENGQRRSTHVGEFTMYDLVLDLHADQEKKDGHQGIVDPGVYRQAQTGEGQLHLPNMVVGILPWRVRPQKSGDGRAQQQDAADALNVDKPLDGQDQGARHQRFAQPDLKLTVCARRDSHKL